MHGVVLISATSALHQCAVCAKKEALRLRDGMVFISGTRTNAGAAPISVFRQLHRFGVPGERLIVIQTSGNLATTRPFAELAGNKAGADFRPRAAL